MLVIYTAGPYRASTREKIEVNIRAAQAVALQVCKLGAYPFCPHLNTAHFDGYGVSDELILAGCREVVGRCDGVLMFGDWEISEGATMERDLARDCGVCVFYELSELKDWIESQRAQAKAIEYV